MATIKIGKRSAIYQVEMPLSVSPDGSATTSLTYKILDNVNEIQIPAHLTVHPDPDYKDMLAYEMEMNQEEGNVSSVTVTYLGVYDNNPEKLAQHDFQRNVAEAPIGTHPRYAIPFDDPPVTKFDHDAIELALRNCTGLPPLIQGKNGPDQPSALCTELFLKKRKGVESYYRSGATYRRSYVSPDPPSNALINSIGKIFKSLSHPAPSPPENQSYLLMAVSWSKQAGVIYISEEYQLSGITSWDEDLYEDA